jgi:hypothetical protein
MNRATELLIKLLGIAAIVGAAFVLVVDLVALGWEWAALALWALVAVPAVYSLWRIDLSGEAQP